MALVQTTVIAPGAITAQNPAGATPAAASGGAGEGLVAELHGKWYTMARAGLVFVATQSAAITLPIGSAALVSKFTLVNPFGSGKTMELIDLDFASVSATEVVNAVQLATQPTVAGATGLASTTTGTILNCLIGQATAGQSSVGTYYLAATHTGTPTILQNLFDVTATAAGISNTHYEFDGKVLLGPGSIAALVTSTAALTNAVANIRWAEFPV